MEKETQLVLDTLDKIKLVQELMNEWQYDNAERIEVLKAQIEQNKALLKEFRANNFEWR